MMLYSVYSKDKIIVKSIDFYLLLKIWAKTWKKRIDKKTSKHLSGRNNQNLLDNSKQCAIDALKIGNKIAC